MIAHALRCRHRTVAIWFATGAPIFGRRPRARTNFPNLVAGKSGTLVVCFVVRNINKPAELVIPPIAVDRFKLCPKNPASKFGGRRMSILKRRARLAAPFQNVPALIAQAIGFREPRR